MSKVNLLKGFKKPNMVKVESGKSDEFKGSFVAGPFQKGFGVTIANSLRRSLLSSVQSYAITAIKVDYYDGNDKKLLTNETESIVGVREDTIQIIARLKKVNLMLLDDVESKTIEVDIEGPGVLTAADLNVEGVKVFNSDFKLANLNDDAKFTMMLQIDYGRGYRPTSDISSDMLDTIGTIPIDAIFSPVTNVTFSITQANAGQKEGLDEVTLDIETNGTVTPEDALAKSALILKEHFNCFMVSPSVDESIDAEFEVKVYNEDDEKLKSILNTPVEELELSVRSSNCLENAHIKTIGDLIIKSEDDMVKTKNFGKKSLGEIQNKLDNYGLSLGMSNMTASEMKERIKDVK